MNKSPEEGPKETKAIMYLEVMIDRAVRLKQKLELGHAKIGELTPEEVLTLHATTTLKRHDGDQIIDELELNKRLVAAGTPEEPTS